MECLLNCNLPPLEAQEPVENAGRVVVWAENLFATWLFAGEACQISAQNNPPLTLPFFSMSTISPFRKVISAVVNHLLCLLVCFFLYDDDDLLIKLVILSKNCMKFIHNKSFWFRRQGWFWFWLGQHGLNMSPMPTTSDTFRNLFSHFRCLFFYLGRKKGPIWIANWRVQSFRDCCFVVSNKVGIGYVGLSLVFCGYKYKSTD